MRLFLFIARLWPRFCCNRGLHLINARTCECVKCGMWIL